MPAILFAAILCAAALAALAPGPMSVWAVFLFAGPHNWMEARYFLARMPVRWGRSRAFFTTAIAGVILLSFAWALGPAGGLSRALWHTGLILWILTLGRLRRRPFPVALWPLGLALLSAAWMAPHAADLALLFVHPLIALWFLDIQIGRSRPEWRRSYRWLLASLPAILALLWMLSPAPAAARDPRLLPAHVFLETLHYGAWVLALPAIGLAGAPWRWRTIPLIRHRDGWPRLARAALLAGGAAVLLLWICLAADYNAVRDAYFTVAIAHVLAEAPFLIRFL